MANPKNETSLAELKQRFADTDSLVLTEYRGLTVAQTTELRKALGADVQYSIAKNTLLKLAAKHAGVEGLDELFVGPTAVAFIQGEAVDAAKALKKFAAENKALVVKGGYMDGNPLTAEQVDAIAELDNRETTLAKLAGAMKGQPVQGRRTLQRSGFPGCSAVCRASGEKGSGSLIGFRPPPPHHYFLFHRKEHHYG